MKRILVVDDERLVADTLTLILRSNGFDARTAYSAAEALEVARALSPELLVCDITMPGRDGLQLMADFNQEFPDCRILVLTGYYSNLKNVRDYASRLPIPPAVLTKPCHPEEFLLETQLLLAS